MKRTAIAFVCVLIAVSAWSAELTPADAVAALRDREASYEDWKPVLDVGKPCVPELKKLLGDPNEHLRAQAAALLYRLGEASALDTLAGLLASSDDAARKEAAEGLLAFVGQPMDLDPAAPEAERAAALARWNAWWKANRDKALAQPPMKALYGKVTAIDAATKLVGTSLTGRHGLQRGMTVQVRRGDTFVCQLEVLGAAAEGSLAKIVPLSARTEPQVGDPVFVLLKRGAPACPTPTTAASP